MDLAVLRSNEELVEPIFVKAGFKSLLSYRVLCVASGKWVSS